MGSIDTLIWAAAYLERQAAQERKVKEKKLQQESRKPQDKRSQDKKRQKSESNSSDNDFNAAVNHHHHHNHHLKSDEPRPKIKKTRDDDLFCSEKLIIDEEEPIENHVNGTSNHLHSPNHQSNSQNHHHQNNQRHQQQQHQNNNNNNNVIIANNNNNNNNNQHASTQNSGQLVGSPQNANGAFDSAAQAYQQEYHQHDGSANSTSSQMSHYIDSHHNSNSNHSHSSGSGLADLGGGGGGGGGGGSEGRKSRNNSGASGGFRTGTREVHNKLEKNRRAHLKECFEFLKKQLPNMEDKKTSNLAVLAAAIHFIKRLQKRALEMDHEMTGEAKTNISHLNRIKAIKTEMSLDPQWRHVDLDKMFPVDAADVVNVSNSVSESADSGMHEESELSRGGARYSSTSSLSSAATASSPQTIQPSPTSSSSSTASANSNGQSSPPSITSPPTSSTAAVAAAPVAPVSQAISTIVVSQAPSLSSLSNGNVGHPNPKDGSRGTAAHNSSATTKEKLTVVQQQQVQQVQQQVQQTTIAHLTAPHQQQVQQQQTIQQQQQQQPQPAPTQLHLPINAQVIVPALQHLGSGLRVIQGPGDGRQLIAVQSNGTVSAATSNGEPRSVALVVHSAGNEVRPVTLYGNEARPIVLATTHGSAISVNNAQTRLRAAETTQATQKMIGGVTLVGGTGTELARLPGGAELSQLLPTANGVFRSVKTPLTVQGGLTLSHAGVSIQTSKSGTPTQTTTIIQQQTTSSNGGTAGGAPTSGQQITQQHLVAAPPGHQQLAGLTPIVVSQGSQVIIAPGNSLNGKMIGTPLLKPVGASHIAQYISSIGGKPVVVVSNSQQQQAQVSAQQQQQQQQPQQQQQQVVTSNGNGGNALHTTV